MPQRAEDRQACLYCVARWGLVVRSQATRQETGPGTAPELAARSQGKKLRAMRRHPTALAVLLAFAPVFAPGENLHAVEQSPDGLADVCVDQRFEEFVKDGRSHEARLRVELRVLDDECGQDVQAILWKAPGGQISVHVLIADYPTITEGIERFLQQNPEAHGDAICETIDFDSKRVTPEQLSKVPALVDQLEKLQVPAVLEPLLIIHGMHFDLRIESGISESTYSFQGPGHPRPPEAQLHPLDRWSQELLRVIGLDCIVEATEQPSH